MRKAKAAPKVRKAKATPKVRKAKAAAKPHQIKWALATRKKHLNLANPAGTVIARVIVNPTQLPIPL